MLAGLLLASGACRAADQDWTEQVVLHDGRTIAVHSTVKMGYGGGDLSNAMTPRPVEYVIETVNPDTRTPLRWAVPRGFGPLMIDFADGMAYLVTQPVSVFSNLKQFGCPEIPYVFFRFDARTGRWAQMPSSELPRSMLKQNLLIDINNNRRLRGNAIPATFVEWNDPDKNQWRVGHARDGCEASVPSNVDPAHPQSAGTPSRPAALEIVDTTVFTPPLRQRRTDAGLFDLEQDARCQALVQVVKASSDTPELRGWYQFTADPTRRNKALPTGQIWCDDRAIWLPDNSAELKQKRIVLNKYTITGEFVYRISFAQPDELRVRHSGIVQSTFKPKAGVLEFEWVEADEEQGEILVTYRRRKMRIVEPTAASAAPR